MSTWLLEDPEDGQWVKIQQDCSCRGAGSDITLGLRFPPSAGSHAQGGAPAGSVCPGAQGSSGAVCGPTGSTVPRWGTAPVTSAKMPPALSSALQSCPGEAQNCQPTLLL